MNEMKFQLKGGRRCVSVLSNQILWFDFSEKLCFQIFSLSDPENSLSLLIPTIKSFPHLIICNCAAVKVEWRSESDWFGLLIHFISDRRESNSLQITSFNPDTLMPFKIFLLTAFIY